MGDELRSVYKDIPSSRGKQMVQVLSQRRKVVEVTLQTMRTWYQRFSAPAAESSYDG